MLKTGLIQPETIPGQFPRNLRAIVELYRACLDQGAGIIICPPLALGGMHTGELALRSGFFPQHQAALEYLAREIAEIPLLLSVPEADGIRFHFLRSGHVFPQQAVIPHNLTGQQPPSLPAAALFQEPETGEFTVRLPCSSPSSSPPLLLLRAPLTAWHEGQLERDEEEACRLAQETSLPVATVRLAGGEGPFLLPGASSLWSAAGTLLGRLRLFERDAAVIPAETARQGTQELPAPEQQIRGALRKGITDFILKSGHGSAYLNLLESHSSLLLARLIKDAMPALPMTGFIPSPSSGVKQDADEARKLAAGLGIRTVVLPPFPGIEPGSTEEDVMAMVRMRSLAWEEGALFLSALNGTDIMTDRRAMQAAQAADFMPLKDLHEGELAALFPEFMTSGPDAAERGRLLIRLYRDHVSATHLAVLMPDKEQEIRQLQRLARATEWERDKLPPGLVLRSAPGAPGVPAIHQMAD